jgi:hypothetical protein
MRKCKKTWVRNVGIHMHSFSRTWEMMFIRSWFISRKDVDSTSATFVRTCYRTICKYFCMCYLSLKSFVSLNEFLESNSHKLFCHRKKEENDVCVWEKTCTCDECPIILLCISFVAKLFVILSNFLVGLMQMEIWFWGQDHFQMKNTIGKPLAKTIS